MCCQLCVSVSCEPFGMVRRETCSPRVCPEGSTPPCSVALRALCLRGVSASEDKNMQKRQRDSGKSTDLGSILRPVKGTEGRTGVNTCFIHEWLFPTGELAFVRRVSKEFQTVCFPDALSCLYYWWNLQVCVTETKLYLKSCSRSTPGRNKPDELLNYGKD